MRDLLGEQMYGFKFKSRIFYSQNMNKHVGKIGTIIEQHHYDDTNLYGCRVEFENGEVWSYPYLEVLEHLVDDKKPIEEIILNIKQLTSELWKEKT